MNDGVITIGYFEDGELSTGNYIYINSRGYFRVGEVYMIEGRRWKRGIQYNTNGIEFKFGS